MKSLRAVVPVVLFMLASGVLAAQAAEAYPVVGVVDADHVVVNYKGLPVEVGLAHVAVPAAQRERCRERLNELLRSKKSEVLYLPDFGSGDGGEARVHLVVEQQDVAETLIAAGIASYQPAAKRSPSYEEPLKKAQDKAQKAKLGMWAAGAAAVSDTGAAPAPAVAAAASAPSAHAPASAPVSAVASARGPFCSELDSPLYQPSDDPAAASIAPARLIFYPDEASAQRAGKRRRTDAAAGLPDGQDQATADAIEAKGEEIYANAIAAGNSDARDQLYEQSFQVFSKATLIYGTLVDQRPDDDALAEKLRRCMQLRYGSLKQRRVH